MNTPIIETERLILRKFTEEDLEALFLILKDEEVEKADLCRSGVFYVQGHTLWRYYYGDEITERIAAVNSAVKELYCETAGENTAVYLWQEENEIPERILLNGGRS